MKMIETLSGKGEYTSPTCYLIHVRIESSVLSGPATVSSGSIDELDENEYDYSIWK